MRKPGSGNLGNLSQIVAFVSDFPPFPANFTHFFLHFQKCIFGNFSQFPIFPISSHSPPPFPPISPHFATISPFSPLSQAPASRRLVRLRLARMLALSPILILLHGTRGLLAGTCNKGSRGMPVLAVQSFRRCLPNEAAVPVPERLLHTRRRSWCDVLPPASPVQVTGWLCLPCS